MNGDLLEEDFWPGIIFGWPATQGETTSAIVGEVRDVTNAFVPRALVTITNHETGLKRSARTDDAGRFNFPQLKPGAYSVKAEALGFEPQQNDNVLSGLGQKQTVDFILKIARSNEVVEVSSEAPLINPENANTSTTLNAPALENLPNPGGDLTYPLQFAPARSSIQRAAAMISWAAQTAMATWSSTACLPFRTATLSMDSKLTIRLPISTAASPPILCWD
jgi:hypothetical protein